MTAPLVAGTLHAGERSPLAAYEAAVERARVALARADLAAKEAAEVYHRARLALLDERGEHDSASARWCRAWLAGDYVAATACLIEQYPEQERADVRLRTQLLASLGPRSAP